MTAPKRPSVACKTKGCDRQRQPDEYGVRSGKCCLTCGNTSYPDVHLAWCEVRNGTHHSQQKGHSDA